MAPRCQRVQSRRCLNPAAEAADWARCSHADTRQCPSEPAACHGQRDDGRSLPSAQRSWTMFAGMKPFRALGDREKLRSRRLALLKHYVNQREADLDVSAHRLPLAAEQGSAPDVPVFSAHSDSPAYLRLVLRFSPPFRLLPARLWAEIAIRVVGGGCFCSRVPSRRIWMSTPGERSRELGGRRRPPGAWVPRLSPCSNGHGLFCEEAWAAIADKLDLSPRQMEVARCVLTDQSDGEIARVLGLSRGTVHTHMERLHERLHVHSRVQLATQVFAAYLAWRIELPPPTGCPLRSRLESL